MGTLVQPQTRAAERTSSADLSRGRSEVVPTQRSTRTPGQSTEVGAATSGAKGPRFSFNLGRIPIHPAPPAHAASGSREEDTGGDSLAETVTTLRRACACGGSCANCKGQAKEDEGKTLRRQHSGSINPAGGMTPPSVHETLRSSGRTLDARTRGFLEPRFGRDFSDVRIHTGAQAAESARAVDALAYTVGRDVVFGAGQYAPHTRPGMRLLAHELSHTVQNAGDGRVQPFLEVGRVDDPAERAADRAADAAMRGESVIVARESGAGLRRQATACTAKETEREDQREVKCGADDYIVTMSTSDKPGKRDFNYHSETTSPGGPETQVDVNAGLNGSSIYLTIKICRGGTEVRIKPTLDLPKAVERALGKVISGSNVLTGATLTPGVEFTIIHQDDTTVTFTPSVTVDEKGVKEYSGKFNLKTPVGTLGGGGSYDPRTHGATGMLTYELPDKPQKSPDCHETVHTYLTLHCERVTHVPEVPAVAEVTKIDKELRYLFFEKPTANFRKDLKLPTDIKSLYDQGYKVTAVDGFTSPEGPRDIGPGFEGNDALGQERANAALAWLMSKGVCEGCDFSGIQPQGHSELPPVEGKVDPEPKGPKMERDAVNEFLGKGPGQTPDPLAPQDPKSLEAFERQPQSRQTDQAFKLMRRAVITLERTQVVAPAKPGEAARDDRSPSVCTPEVIKAARESFGIRL